MRETIELAFIAALQLLPPRQRAVLVLRDVLGFRSAEAAEMLDASEEAVKGLLKRARATLEENLPRREGAALVPNTVRDSELLKRFVDAWEADDIDGIVALLTEDAWLRMPPAILEYQGPAAIGAFLRERARSAGGHEDRLEPTRANTQPAFGWYLRDEHNPVSHAIGLIVLTLDGDRLSVITCFLGSGMLAAFGMPRTLRD
jgi:RNA polymerase sigma-70 factor (ECF subfamily)